jgi:hypothetical protein
MNELLILLTLLSAALMVGNEFTVGAFINPAFDCLPEQPQAYAARETARVFGRVMPFWMPANLLLNILLVFLVADMPGDLLASLEDMLNGLKIWRV